MEQWHLAGIPGLGSLGQVLHRLAVGYPAEYGRRTWGEMRRWRTLWKCVMSGIVLLLIAGFAQAQAPYMGGSGDGYARGEAIAMIDWDPSELDSVDVFPTVLSPGTTLVVSARDVQNRLTVRIFDDQGRLIAQSDEWNVDGAMVLPFATDRWAAGAYMVEVRRDSRAGTRKIVVQK